METFGYIGAVCIGLILGLTGGGGSILTVPILVYVMLLNPITATAYSLFIVGTTSVFGALQNYRKNLVDIRNGFLFAVPSFTAIYLTRRFIVPKIPTVIIEEPFLLLKSTFLMVFFAVIMIFASLSMLKKKKMNLGEPKEISMPFLIIQTFIIGLIIGLVGAGGGFFDYSILSFICQITDEKSNRNLIIHYGYEFIDRFYG